MYAAPSMASESADLRMPVWTLASIDSKRATGRGA